MYKPVLGGEVVAAAGPEEDVPPIGVVGAVGEELGLQAHGTAGAVDHAALAADGAVQEIGGVELEAGYRVFSA